MKKIIDAKLFSELVETPSWETLFDSTGELKNANIPILIGGLDRIHVGRRSIEFHDIGCNGRDNSFKIVAR